MNEPASGRAGGPAAVARVCRELSQRGADHRQALGVLDPARPPGRWVAGSALVPKEAGSYEATTARGDRRAGGRDRDDRARASPSR